MGLEFYELVVRCHTTEMNCFSHKPENDKKVICRSGYHKRCYMQRTDSESWLGKNDVEQRTSRCSKHVKDVVKLTRNDSSTAGQPIAYRTRSTSEITEDNTVKTTGNG